MKHFDIKKAKKRIVAAVQRSNLIEDWDVADNGQLVIFTDMFLHDDGKLYDQSEDDDDDDDEEDEDNHEILEESFPHDTSKLPDEPIINDPLTKE